MTTLDVNDARQFGTLDRQTDAIENDSTLKMLLKWSALALACGMEWMLVFNTLFAGAG